MDKRMLTPAETCDAVINTGINKTGLSSMQMLILGILAGAYVALGGFASTVASHSVESYGMAKFISGAIFPVGLILVIICGAELFTGNALISLAVYDGKVKISSMLKNWVIVYLGNFIGSFLIAFLIYHAGLLSMNGGKVGAAAIKVAAYKGGLTFSNGIASGILCNLLVCLAVWGAIAAKDIAAKILVIWFPVMAFVVSGFEHSIANMYFFSAGILAKSIDSVVKVSGLSAEKVAGINWAMAISNNLIPVTVGNIIGGAVFVGLLYWAVYRYAPKINIKKNVGIDK